MAGARRSEEYVERSLHLVGDTQREGRASPTHAPDARASADVLAVIETEIIPRLRLAHRDSAVPVVACDMSRAPPTEVEIAEFARIAACHDLPAALGFVETMCRAGLSLEIVLLDLVAASARLLGQHWKEDLRTFNEVSAGLGTLQQVVHVFGPSFAPSLPDRGLVVLVPAPGEQHTLGLFLVGEFLRRAGWGVHIDPSLDQAGLLDLLSARDVLMLGISVSTALDDDVLTRLIASARRASRNRDMTVMLGGTADLTALAARTGSRLAGSDPRETIRMLESRPPAAARES